MALESIWANRLRSALTMLGIIIGVMSVILVVTIGQGGQARILSEMEGLGTNLFAVYIGSVDDGNYERYRLPSRIARRSESVDSINGLVPISYAYTTVEGLHQKDSATIYGTEGDYDEVCNLKMAEGRFFNSVDNAVGRRVMVINQRLAEDMFGSAREAVGKKLKVKQMSVVICGVAESSSGIFGPERPTVYLPIKLHFRLFDSEDNISEIYGTAVSKDQVEDAAKKVIRVLEVRHQAKDPDIYQFVTMAQQMEAADQVLAIITTIIGAIAGISLLVGGIGIMNIMLATVMERTREIGIRRAVGAKKADIMSQFVTEAVVISITGGLLGVVLGIILSLTVSLFTDINTLIKPYAVFIAFGFSVIVGISFGYLPAKKAAELKPIDSIRYE